MQKFPRLLIVDRYALSWSGEIGPDGPRRSDKAGTDGKDWKYDLDEEGVPLCPIYPFVEGDADAWTHRYDFDAHAVMYDVPGSGSAPRIKKKAVRDGVIESVMVWIIIDVDTPDHVDLDDAPIEFMEQVIDAEIAIPEMAHAIRWASKGGYKYAWPLAESRRYPVEIGEDYLGLFLEYLQENGLPVDMQCKDWTRLMRLPNAAREGDPNSGNYEVHGLDTVQPLDWEPPREPMAGGRGTKRVKRSRKTKTQEEIQIARAREAIAFIEPDCDRDAWRDVGIGLKVEFGEAGWPIWRDWSEKGESYPGDDDARYQWESFPDEEIDGGVTIRTLWYLAQEGGWSGRMSIEDAQKTIEDARGLDDYFDPQTLRAAARLREENGIEWAQAIAQVKQDAKIYKGLVYSNWERAVIQRQNEIEKARKIAAAEIAREKREQGDASIVISNFEREINEEGEVIRFRKPLPQVVEEIRSRMAGWPRMMDNVPFMVDEARGEPIYFEKAPELFSWLEIEAGEIEWSGRDLFVNAGGVVRPVTQEGAFNGICQITPKAHRYKTIETIPHVPKVEGAYYIDPDLPEPTGEVLARFLALFAPATIQDGKLLEALILTCMAGLHPGKRPAFVLTSDYGRGSGKSSTANAIARVFGGSIGVNAEDGYSKLEQRLLDPSTTSKRLCIVDNLKNRLSSAEFEAAITTPQISGKRMYVGNGERVNLLTWIFTANTPSLSNDLAARAVVVKIGQADHSVDFEAEVQDILDNHRLQLLADIKARLEEPASGEVVENPDRWQAWQRAVLSRFEDADELAALIKARRGEVDDDAATAAQWAEYIKDLLREKGHIPEEVKTMIPSGQVLKLARKVEGDSTISYREMWNLVADVSGVGEMRHAKRHRTADARGLKWVGERVEPGTPYTDFEKPENRPAEKVTKIDERRKKPKYL